MGESGPSIQMSLRLPKGLAKRLDQYLRTQGLKAADRGEVVRTALIQFLEAWERERMVT